MEFVSEKFSLKALLTIIFILIALMAIVCGKDDPTGPNHETIPPVLLYTNPANTAANVSVDIVISATFSEPVDTITINDTTFTINNGISGTYSFSGNTVYLAPSTPLTYLTVYSCQLTTDITDIVGNRLTGNVSWTFTSEPDPATTFPVVESVSPVNGVSNVAGDAVITATFSKGMDPSTLTGSSFSLNNGATGLISYNNKTATFTPDDTLLYDTTYIATITTAVADTFGNHLESEYSWSFSTIDDPFTPIVTFSHPFDSAIVDDTVTIIVDIDHPVGVDSVEFYVDDILIIPATDLTAPYQYQVDASSWEIGSLHDIWTKAYYGPDHIGYSDTLEIIYLWQIMAVDNDFESIPQDLRRVFARSTDDVLELRYEFGTNWTYPYPRTDEQVNDSIINLGIYLDTDVNPSTGDPTLGDPGIPLNGIGADHQVILSSLIARDTNLSVWNDNVSPPFWELVYDTTGFNYHNVPVDTNILEFGLNWSDLNNSYGAYIVSFHAFAVIDINGIDTNITYIIDWLPNQGGGYVTVAREGRYLGAPFSAGKIFVPEKLSHDSPAIKLKNNPFK